MATSKATAVKAKTPATKAPAAKKAPVVKAVTVSKSDVISLVSAKVEISKVAAEHAINATLEVLTEILAKGEEVRLANFGAFTVKSREARKGRNPLTGAEIDIAASKSVGFKPAKGLKDALNG